MKGIFKRLLSGVLLGTILAPVVASAEEAAITGRDVMERCNFKNPGQDQQTTLTILLRDKDGNEKKNVYRRYWKDYGGKDGIADKMILHTEFPPDARGTVFMRWGYIESSDKNAEQWIYLPVLKKIRRVSIRDPGDSFLGSDLTYGDISPRGLDADDHKLGNVQRRGNAEIVPVESTPREKNPLYGRVVSWFTLTNGDWDTCGKVRVDYYDRKGAPLKQQNLKWQRVDGAWVWDEVTVSNVQTKHTSIFQVSDVKINTGLKDDAFSERALTAGE